jgi:HTH-type transcriptional regulator/antitoxin HigA
MITNERQYKITRTQLRGFEKALTAAVADGPGIDIDPRIHQAMIAGLEGQIDDLKAQLERYETLKTGHMSHGSLTSILDLLPALIEARIAAGLTQRSLSERLGVAEQQVQKWESTTYAGVSVERVQNVADAVGLTIREEVTYGRTD